MTGVMELAELVLTPDERARGVGVDSVLFTMDWAGEEQPGGLAAFVAGRVRAFGAQPADVDTGVVRQAAEADPTLGRGDLPIRQLDHLSGVLAPLGFTLAVRDDGTDSYPVLVLLTGGQPPSGLTHRGRPVRAWGATPDETPVSLDCPHCGALLVWQLPATESLAGEHCDCGAALFDAAGRPLPDVTLHD
ncbi:hypothetical protein [Micromonospora sp. HUAS LYJ1]|uniref:hypothetical protein n=1 Tax=Micromonospora sp. HUAS LYJ1 TaxID=3061626 RepID=UPI0026738CA9|nr:hypothetical protein [Micromonospora sp. HUAS LYJ1]WKU06794.1 hypothetical protein Q2K16_07010 [Micromonospora sp. HUAS LYJ1]